MKISNTCKKILDTGQKTSHQFDLHLFDQAQLLGGGSMDQKPLGMGFPEWFFFQSGHPETR